MLKLAIYKTLGLIFFYCFVTANLCLAQEIAQSPTQEEFQKSIEDIKSRISLDTTSKEDDKQEVNKLVQSSEANLRQIDEANKEITNSQLLAESAAKRSQDFQSELKVLKESEPEQVDNSQDEGRLDRLNSRSSKLNGELDGLNGKLTKLQEKIAGRNDELQKLLKSIETADANANATREKIRLLPADDGSILAAAKRVDLNTELRNFEIEKLSLVAQQKRFEGEENADLLRHEQDLMKLKLQRAQTFRVELESAIAQENSKSARVLVAKAQKEMEEIGKDVPELIKSYENNLELAKRVRTVESRVQKLTLRRDQLRTQLSSLEELKRTTETRVKAGYSGSVGAMLRKRRTDLNTQSGTRIDLVELKTELNEIQFEIFEKEEQRSQLNSEIVQLEIESYVNKKLTPLELSQLDSPIEELITKRKDLLASVDGSLDRLFERLIEIQFAEAKLESITAEFREYINERILWIRSNDILLSDLELDETDSKPFQWTQWREVFVRLNRMLKAYPFPFCVSALAIFSLIFFKPRMRNEIDRLGQVASRGTCDSVWPTIHALVLTVLVAIAFPLIPLVAGLGIRLTSSTTNTLFDAIGSGLLAAAWFGFPTEIIRRMCRTKGLANIHFDWPNVSVFNLKKNLDRLVLPAACLVFATVLFLSLDDIHRTDLIERILFVVTLGLFTYFLFKILNPNGGIFSAYLNRHENGWANQTSYVWFGFILLIPISLAFLTIWGYYFTAINLSSCAYMTFVFALVAETCRALLRRFVLLSRRRVHIQAARRKREIQIQAQKELRKVQELARQAEAKSRKSADSKSQIDTSKLPAPTFEPIQSIESLMEAQPADEVDNNAIRATKLISLVMFVVWGLGMFMIWSEVLPALKALDQITVWKTDKTGNVVVASDSSESTNEAAAMNDPLMGAGNASGNTAEQSGGNRVSVRDLLIFLLISSLTFVLATNLPGAVEMLFLDNLPVDRSFRYAAKAITSYVIVMLGMILAFRALSISWENVQWLATALTFGLAFGLQEIFANFVAGIILMFERPIRIGDWVTVDEYTGVVTKIRTRATTIVNWDRKECVIPNKDFITGRLVNWTLSDNINRIVIQIGVGYGSDIVKAKEILLKICEQHPKIISDPSTSVAFDNFGDNSLNLTLRTYLGDVDGRLSVIDDLHTQINQAFNDAKIEISFPQQDLHVRSIDGLAIEAIKDLGTESK